MKIVSNVLGGKVTFWPKDKPSSIDQHIGFASQEDFNKRQLSWLEADQFNSIELLSLEEAPEETEGKLYVVDGTVYYNGGGLGGLGVENVSDTESGVEVTVSGELGDIKTASLTQFAPNGTFVTKLFTDGNQRTELYAANEIYLTGESTSNKINSGGKPLSLMTSNTERLVVSDSEVSITNKIVSPTFDNGSASFEHNSGYPRILTSTNFFSINTDQGSRLVFGNNYASIYGGASVSIYSGYGGSSLGVLNASNVKGIDGQGLQLATQATDLTSARLIKFQTASVPRWRIDNLKSNAFEPVADNSYDVGLSTSRVRTGYFGTSVVTPRLENTDATLVVHGGANLFASSVSSDGFLIMTGNTIRARMNINDWTPYTDQQGDIGRSTLRWNTGHFINVNTAGVNISNSDPVGDGRFWLNGTASQEILFNSYANTVARLYRGSDNRFEVPKLTLKGSKTHGIDGVGTEVQLASSADGELDVLDTDGSTLGSIRCKKISGNNNGLDLGFEWSHNDTHYNMLSLGVNTVTAKQISGPRTITLNTAYNGVDNKIVSSNAMAYQASGHTFLASDGSTLGSVSVGTVSTDKLQGNGFYCNVYNSFRHVSGHFSTGNHGVVGVAGAHVGIGGHLGFGPVYGSNSIFDTRLARTGVGTLAVIASSSINDNTLGNLQAQLVRVGQGSSANSSTGGIRNYSYPHFGWWPYDNNKSSLGRPNIRVMHLGLNGSVFSATVPSDGILGFQNSVNPVSSASYGNHFRSIYHGIGVYQSDGTTLGTLKAGNLDATNWGPSSYIAVIQAGSSANHTIEFNGSAQHFGPKQWSNQIDLGRSNYQWRTGYFGTLIQTPRIMGGSNSAIILKPTTTDKANYYDTYEKRGQGYNIIWGTAANSSQGGSDAGLLHLGPNLIRHAIGVLANCGNFEAAGLWNINDEVTTLGNAVGGIAVPGTATIAGSLTCNNDINFGGGTQVKWSDSTVMRPIYGNGTMRFTNSTYTSGVNLDVNTDGVLTIKTKDNTSDGGIAAGKFVARQNVGETENLAEWQDSAGVVQSFIDSNGSLTINDNSQLIHPLRVKTASQPYAFSVTTFGRTCINTSSASSDLNVGGAGIISAVGTANQLKNFDTLQTGSSGTNRLKINAGEIYIGGMVSSSTIAIKAHNTTFAAIGIQQITGGSNKMILIKDSNAVETMGITTAGFTQAGDGNGLSRFDFAHTVSPSSADGDGVGINFRTENASGSLTDVAYIDTVFDDISVHQASFRIMLKDGSSSNSTPREVVKIDHDAKMTVSGDTKVDGDIESIDATKGLVLKDASGNRYRYTAEDGTGNLVITAL